MDHKWPYMLGLLYISCDLPAQRDNWRKLCCQREAKPHLSYLCFGSIERCYARMLERQPSPMKMRRCSRFVNHDQAAPARVPLSRTSSFTISSCSWRLTDHVNRRRVAVIVIEKSILMLPL